MSDEQGKTPEGQPTEEAAAQKQAAEAKADAVDAAAAAAAAAKADAGAVQQPADIADTAKTAPAGGEKKPMTDEEKAAAKAAALEKAAAAKAAKAAAAGGEGAAAAPAAAAKPKPAHEEDPNKPIWEKDPVAPTWMDGADDPLTQALKEELGDAIESARSYAGDLTFQVRRDAIAQVAVSLKNRHRFTYLVDLCGADYPKREPRFDVVYQLHNFETNRRIRLKVATDEATPVPTVSGVWRVANWPEREVYDMFGVRFEGHPDMTRILLWEGFNGYPLRKDFPVEGIDTGSAIYPEYYNETAGPVNNAGTGWKPPKPPEPLAAPEKSPEPPAPSAPPAGASEATK